MSARPSLASIPILTGPSRASGSDLAYPRPSSGSNLAGSFPPGEPSLASSFRTSKSTPPWSGHPQLASEPVLSYPAIQTILSPSVSLSIRVNSSHARNPAFPLPPGSDLWFLSGRANPAIQALSIPLSGPFLSCPAIQAFPVQHNPFRARYPNQVCPGHFRYPYQFVPPPLPSVRACYPSPLFPIRVCAAIPTRPGLPYPYQAVSLRFMSLPSSMPPALFAPAIHTSSFQFHPASQTVSIQLISRLLSKPLLPGPASLSDPNQSVPFIGGG